MQRPVADVRRIRRAVAVSGGVSAVRRPAERRPAGGAPALPRRVRGPRERRLPARVRRRQTAPAHRRTGTAWLASFSASFRRAKQKKNTSGTRLGSTVFLGSRHGCCICFPLRRPAEREKKKQTATPRDNIWPPWNARPPWNNIGPAVVGPTWNVSFSISFARQLRHFLCFFFNTSHVQ